MKILSIVCSMCLINLLFLTKSSDAADREDWFPLCPDQENRPRLVAHAIYKHISETSILAIHHPELIPISHPMCTSWTQCDGYILQWALNYLIDAILHRSRGLIYKEPDPSTGHETYSIKLPKKVPAEQVTGWERKKQPPIVDHVVEEGWCNGIKCVIHWNNHKRCYEIISTYTTGFIGK